MTLSDLADIGDILGAIAVFVTLALRVHIAAPVPAALGVL